MREHTRWQIKCKWPQNAHLPQPEVSHGNEISECEATLFHISTRRVATEWADSSGMSPRLQERQRLSGNCTSETWILPKLLTRSEWSYEFAKSRKAGFELVQTPPISTRFNGRDIVPNTLLRITRLFGYPQLRQYNLIYVHSIGGTPSDYFLSDIWWRPNRYSYVMIYISGDFANICDHM